MMKYIHMDKGSGRHADLPLKKQVFKHMYYIVWTLMSQIMLWNIIIFCNLEQIYY